MAGVGGSDGVAAIIVVAFFDFGVDFYFHKASKLCLCVCVAAHAFSFFEFFFSIFPHFFRYSLTVRSFECWSFIFFFSFISFSLYSPPSSLLLLVLFYTVFGVLCFVSIVHNVLVPAHIVAKLYTLCACFVYIVLYCSHRVWGEQIHCEYENYEKCFFSAALFPFQWYYVIWIKRISLSQLSWFVANKRVCGFLLLSAYIYYYFCLLFVCIS